jgi:hypothetical protein
MGRLAVTRSAARCILLTRRYLRNDTFLVLPKQAKVWYNKYGMNQISNPVSSRGKSVSDRHEDCLCRLYRNHHCCTTVAVQAVQEWCNSGNWVGFTGVVQHSE